MTITWLTRGYSATTMKKSTWIRGECYERLYQRQWCCAILSGSYNSVAALEAWRITKESCQLSSQKAPRIQGSSSRPNYGHFHLPKPVAMLLVPHDYYTMKHCARFYWAESAIPNFRFCHDSIESIYWLPFFGFSPKYATGHLPHITAQ